MSNTAIYQQLKQELAACGKRVAGPRGLTRTQLLAEYELKYGVRIGSYYRWERTQNGAARRADAGKMRAGNEQKWRPKVEAIHKLRLQMSDFELGRMVSSERALQVAAQRGVIEPGEIGARYFNTLVARFRLNVPRGFCRLQAGSANEVHQMDVSGSPYWQVVELLETGDFVLKRRNPRARLEKWQKAQGFRVWYFGLVDDYSGLAVLRYFVARGESALPLYGLLLETWNGVDPSCALRGLPDKIFTDNGSFANNTMTVTFLSPDLGCGIEQLGRLPYNPRATGKMERVWSSVKRDFESPFLANPRQEFLLSELNGQLLNWCVAEGRKPHRYEAEARETVYLRSLSARELRLPADNLLRTALRTMTRTVDGAGCFRLENVIYHLPDEFRSQKVLVYRNALDELMVESPANGERIVPEVWTGPLAYGEYRASKETETERVAKQRAAGEWGDISHPLEQGTRNKEQADSGHVQTHAAAKIIPFVVPGVKEAQKDSPFTVAARFGDEIAAKKWIANELGIALGQFRKDYVKLWEELQQLLGRTLDKQEVGAWVEQTRAVLYGTGQAEIGGGR